MAFDQFRGRAIAPVTAAHGADLSVSQIHRFISAGYIKAAKLGHRITRIDGDSFADFLTSRLGQDRLPRGKAAKKHTAIELAGQA